MKKNIVISSGDPGGIGAQIIIKSLNKLRDNAILREKYNIFILGDVGYYEYICSKLGINKFWEKVYKLNEVKRDDQLEGFIFIDFNNVREYNLGETNSLYGKASIEYLAYAIDLYKRGSLWGLITAPICKKSWWEAGYKYAGHTHYLAVKLRRKDVIMSMLSEKLRIFFVTDHIPFNLVPKYLKELRIRKTIEAAIECMKLLKKGKDKIGVCSLNPHAGEGGIFGNEEEIIIKACNYWIKEGYDIVGPISPELCFKRAIKENVGAVIVMYHDQGMIPFKLFSKGEGINVSWGIPFLRISPEHGTAFDIAKNFIADEASMLYAFKFILDNF